MDDEDGSVVPLVRSVDGVLVADEDALTWLGKRREPFAVMTCAGKFRTGKSYLLNRFAECDFGVGETVQACTRGLWMCRKFLRGETDVLVVDTEGIDALDVESEHDARVFALAILLASVFCYNSTSHLDETSVKSLSVMTRVAEALSEDTHRPALYWVLRDFSLQMTDGEGKSMTHEQYLETALSAPECPTREAVKRVFEQRHLVTLPRPHKGDHARLGRGVPNAKFEKFVQMFRGHVTRTSAPMSVAGVAMTGAVYAEHVRNVVRLVNQTGSVPPLGDAWALLARAQHADARAEARRQSLSVVRSDACPVGTEETVRRYVRERCTVAFEDVKFMPPVPDAEREIDDLVSEGMAAARDLGRIVDVEHLSAARAEEVIRACRTDEGAAETWDVLSLLSAELEWERKGLGGSSFPSKLLAGVVKELWPSAREQLASLREDVRRLTDESARLAEDAEQAKRREDEMRVHVCRPREDACTSTDDDLPAPDVAADEEERERVAQQAVVGAKLEEATERADAAHAKAAALEAQAVENARAYEEALAVLDADARRAMCESAEKAKRACDEADAARQEADAARSQADAMTLEIERLHRLVRDGNDKALEIFRLSREDTRRREVESDGERRSHAEAVARAEGSERESRHLKRRVDELLDLESEVKRLRATVHVHEVEVARLHAVAESTRDTLALVRSERDDLRSCNLGLTGRVSALEALQKVDAYRASWK